LANSHTNAVRIVVIVMELARMSNSYSGPTGVDKKTANHVEYAARRKGYGYGRATK